jgi:hypothetical protein
MQFGIVIFVFTVLNRRFLASNWLSGVYHSDAASS